MSNNAIHAAEQQISELQAMAKEAGVTIKAACAEAKIPESTLWNWVKKPPTTLVKFNQIKEAIVIVQARQGTKTDAAS